MWAVPLFVHDDAPPALQRAAARVRQRPFVPPRLLAGGHRQTLVGTGGRAHRPPSLESFLVPLDDDATVRVHAPAGAAHAGRPLLVVLHGLGGDVTSPYMMRIAHKTLARGLTPVLVELYAATTKGRPPVFHAGQGRGLCTVARALKERLAVDDVRVVAVSLGGNIVLRALGEEGADAPFSRAAVISPLVDLIGTYRALERPVNRAYAAHFLTALKRRLADEHARYAPHVDLEPVFAARTVRAFDAAFTAPLGGFVDVFDYYRRASALPLMERITVPTLVLHAGDDPLIPYENLLRPEAHKSASVVVAVAAHGGHAGFVARDAGADPDRRWAENRALDFLAPTAEDT